jgi:hypothetical protein
MELYNFELLNARSQELLVLLTHDVDRVGKTRSFRFKPPFKIAVVIEQITEFADSARLYSLNYYRNRATQRRWLVEIMLVRQPDARFAALSSRNRRKELVAFFKAGDVTLLDKAAQIRLTKFVDLLLRILANNIAL